MLAAVRDAIGPRHLLGLRLCCDELAPWAGVTPGAGAEQARELSRWLDLLVVVRGGLYSGSAYRPGGHTAPLFNASLARQVRDALDAAVPVVLKGSVTDPHAARDALDGGACDLVEERRERTGGALRTAARAPGRERLALLADWLDAECRRLGVRIDTGTEIGPADLAGARRRYGGAARDRVPARGPPGHQPPRVARRGTGGLVLSGGGPEDGRVRADPETLRRARQIAARLAVPRPRRDTCARRGAGELASVRYRGGSDDIDLDRTVEQLVEHPVPEEDNIIVRERVQTRRSVVLLVDVSGSMRGERIRTAAATVGALGAELDRDGLAVVAFWSDAAVLSHLGRRVPAQRLLEEMLRIPARGLTNLAFPLQVAATELARDARVVLLSDCVHNAGPDPRPLAARLPRLDVLPDTSGEQDGQLARDLARVGRGRLRLIRAYTDVAPALSAVFAS